MHLTEKGLILREVSYKDTDVMLTILTECDGKLSAVARGVRRKNSRLSAGVQLLAYSDFTLFENAGRYTINEAEPIELFYGLRNNIEKLSLASYFAEVLDIAADSETINPELLRLGLNTFYALSKTTLDLRIVKAAFELKIAALSGYQPYIEACGACGCIPTAPVLDINKGMLFCRQCADQRDSVVSVDASVLDAMRHIFFCDLKRIFSFSIGAESLDVLYNIAERYLQTHFDRGFRTLTFYKSLMENQ